jgi:competence protein ComEA
VRRREGGARAAFVLALGLGAAGLAPPRTLPECAAPGERAAAGGWSVEVGCGAAVELRGPARLLFGRGVDPNLADAATLEALPGIGPGRARALVEARGNSPYCAPKDLQRVKGIGPRTLETLEPWLVFDEISGCERAPHLPIRARN